MKTETITFSKGKAMFKCCIAAGLIAIAIGIIGNIGIRQFLINIMEWNSI